MKAIKYDLKTKNILRDAFDCALLVSEFTGNVIASGEGSEDDIDKNKIAKRYIRWYKKHPSFLIESIKQI